MFPSQGRLIALGGRTGAGKTTLAYALREKLPALAQALVIGNDEVRRDLWGISLEKDMPPEAYAPEISARVEIEIYRRIEGALETGQSVISHAGYFSSEGQERLAAFLKAHPTRALGLWLDVPEERLIERVQKRLAERAAGTGLSLESGHASDADLTVLLEKFKTMHAPHDAFWQRINADRPILLLVRDIAARLQAFSP